jgi:thiol-disulfide isomerase/thioredoxin
MLDKINFMKIIFFSLLMCFLFFVVLTPFASAQNTETIYMTLFYGDTCPHCAKEEVFLHKLEEKYPNIKINYYEIYNNSENARLLKDVADKLNVQAPGVPFLVIGDEVVVGYLSEESTGKKIENIIKDHSEHGCIDFVGTLSGAEDQDECKEGVAPETISLPGFGEVNIKTWSLPVLTIVIAALDGFNPCAMWVLLFLISLLLGMEDRRRMWILGATFIFSSGIVYFLFLSAWLNLFLFLGFIAAIRIVIGLVAVGSGAYHLREWRVNKGGECKATSSNQKVKIMKKLRQVTEQKTFWLAFGGIIVLAFAVNLIELVCSAGLPAIYTQILSLSGLNPLHYYLYLLLYIAIFMLDDMIVFTIAMVTLKAFGFDGKLSRWSNLIGGIVILILGLLLIFKPGWVVFG